jgi:hypothetical protein
MILINVSPSLRTDKHSSVEAADFADHETVCLCKSEVCKKKKKRVLYIYFLFKWRGSKNSFGN